MDIKEILEQNLEQTNKHLSEFEQLWLSYINQYIQLRIDNTDLNGANQLFKNIMDIQTEIKKLRQNINTINEQLQFIKNFTVSKFDNQALENCLELINSDLTQLENSCSQYVEQYVELIKNNTVSTDETKALLKEITTIQMKIKALNGKMSFIENQITVSTSSPQREYTPEEAQMLRSLFEAPLNNTISNPDSENTDDFSTKM